MKRIRQWLINNKYITDLHTENKEKQSSFQKNETKTNANDGINIYAKRLFLTYSSVDKEMTADELLQLLQNKVQLGKFEYIIARERVYCDATKKVLGTLFIIQ